jgi:hypothetical protein
MTASFFKELLRKATIASVESGHAVVTGRDLADALDEMLHDTAALTRVLLGSGEPSTQTSSSAHAWMQISPTVIE